MKPKKSTATTDLQLGDVAQVRSGFVDPDTKVDMSGWCGRVTEFYPEEGTAMIAFDSHTLKAMPPKYIKRCEREGYDWQNYGYDLTDLSKVAPRDNADAVTEQAEQLADAHAYDHLGDEGDEIQRILATVDPEQEMDELSTWREYLEENLKLPLDAVVDEGDGRGPLRVGDKIRIHGLGIADEDYGIIVRVRRGREQFHYPLCDIAAADPKSPTNHLIDLYRTWFANRH